MKQIKIFSAFFSLAFLFVQSGCVKDVRSETNTYTFYEPVYKTVAEVIANIKSNTPKPVKNAGKICISGNYIFLNEVDKGIHVIDNRNPSAPVNVAFIDIPGNVDIAIKSNILYADFYADLLAIDISDPMHVAVKKTVHHIFPVRYYYGYQQDSGRIITDWIKKTVTVKRDDNTYPPIYTMGCFFNSADAGFSLNKVSAAPVGISGSLSRFAIINANLYSVSYDSLRITNISNLENPLPANAVSLGWGIETIFPFKDKLFLGSNAGMFIYDVQDPLNPAKLGTFEHVRTCDPVIADDNTAYVTLHSGTACAGFTNQLEVLNITDLMSPKLIKTYPLTNPRGLSKDGNLLFICDGDAGLKIFYAEDANAITLMRTFAMKEANDVIAYNNIALVIATDGLYQYDYSVPTNIQLLSKIAIQND